SAVNINDVEIGFSPLAAVLFIQGQGTRRARTLLVQPSLSALPRFLHDPYNASQADVHTTHSHHTLLDIAVTGMRFYQQSQNRLLYLSCALTRFLLAFQSCFQGPGSSLFPAIQRLTRDLLPPTQFTQQPMS